MKFLRETTFVLVHWILFGWIRLRYRIRIEGLEKITAVNPEAGFLFLPNHPAQIDPVILMMVLWSHYHTRPLVIQYFFEMRGVYPLMRLVRALSIPNMNGSSNQWKVHQVEKLFHTVVEGLKQKESFLLYPAGRLKFESEELLGGASFTYNLLSEFPDANVVLVRTRGLWGSSFSRALTGKVPPFGKMILQGIKYILKNGIFFAPKRDVTIEFEMAPKQLPIRGTRLEFNQFLERWYNAKPDPLRLVSYTFWKETLPEVIVTNEGQVVHVKKKVPKSVRQEVFDKLSSLSHRKVESIHDESDLWTDLGLDSLDMAHIYTYLEDTYDVMGLEPGELQSVDDVLQAAVGRKKLLWSGPERKKPELKWPKEPPRKAALMPEGETLQEVFLRSCDRLSKQTACADSMMEVCLSFRRLKTTAIALSLEVKKLPGKYVGVMLPSSAPAYISILAILLANKTPVMLNWTVGARAIDHAIDVTQLACVLSARRFLERLENVELGKAEEKLLLLEEFKRRLTFREKVKGLILSFCSASTLLKKLKLSQVKKDDPAVILFTSGTEALPKGVPLSHENILSNQRSALSCVDFNGNDVLHAVLPPFHSFGFSVTGLVPLLFGLKACYAPDPTDSRQMVADIEHWKVTLLCCAPSFLQGLFHVARPGQLKNVRYVVSGAEKAPEALFDAVSALAPKAQLIEGYGITECSPIVTLNRPYTPPRGVGQPIPGVELCTIDPETEQQLPPGSEGEICIAGPNIFAGYLGIKKDPFIALSGKKWYRSGDRGHIDQDGYLILSGRLKRFVKMGGEMVSLGAVEEEIYTIAQERKWGESAETPQFALSFTGQEGEKPKLVLYTVLDLSRDQINDALKERGVGRLVKIAEVKKVNEIPVTATGKIQYRKLDEQA